MALLVLIKRLDEQYRSPPNSSNLTRENFLQTLQESISEKKALKEESEKCNSSLSELVRGNEDLRIELLKLWMTSLYKKS